MLEMSFAPNVIPVSHELKKALAKTANEHITLSETQKPTSFNHFTFNFKDSTYDPDAGGFRPIEISITKDFDGNWQIDYITEFAYFGTYYPELERSIDFDFFNGAWFTPHSGWLGLTSRSKDAKELFALWEENFLCYLDMGCYDLVKVHS
ncbi:TPA: DUF2787 family protein [Photobacterium damselae]